MKFLHRLRSLFRKGKLDAEMAAEMRHHVELQTERNRAAGMDPDEARYAALRQFGNVASVQERAREQRSWVWLEQFMQDMRYSARSLAKAPGFTLSVVATLAIGIGATTAIVSIARRVLLPQLPFPAAEQLVVLDDVNVGQGMMVGLLTPRLAYYRDHAVSFSGLATERTEMMNLVIQGEPRGVLVGSVTADYFRVFGVPPAVGRYFLPDEFARETGSVAVLSNEVWQARFAADPGIVGRDILLGGQMRRVVGVMSKSFKPPLGFSGGGVFLPMALSSDYPADPFKAWVIGAVGRLKPGVTREQAQAELAAMTTMPDFGRPGVKSLGLTPRLSALGDDRFGIPSARMFWVFFGAVALLYVIACCNAANLVLGRSLLRRRELGVRLALGGSRGRIVRLLLAEATLLVVAGGAAGLLIAIWSWSAMAPLLPPATFLFGGDLRLNGATVVIALALSALTCVLVSLVPAWRVTRLGVNETLKESVGSLGDSRRLGRLRNGFIIAQAALAVVLLLGAGLLTRSFGRLKEVGVGFDPANKLVITGQLPAGISLESYSQCAARFTEQLASLPGIERVAVMSVEPLLSNATATVKVDGRADLAEFRCAVSTVSEDYFLALGIPLRAGRGLSELKLGDPPVVVIDEKLARRAFAGESPLGKFLECEGRGKWEIVGVVGNVRDMQPHADPVPHLYCPAGQLPDFTGMLTMVLRVAGPVGPQFEASVRRAAFAADPRLVISKLAPLVEQVRARLNFERSAMALLHVISALAVALSALGLFAVMAYAVAQRRREFGVRMALGATPENLQWFVLGRGLRLTLLGIGLGLGAAWGLTRLLQSVLFETSPHDPLTYGAVAIGLLIVAALACWLPARRAAKVDPMVALRAE